ncbi:UNVERIFIED_CONTAM: hypothetical protein Slati_3712800 [Sesamum latifolium]|uniref:Reverse transcriptase Ty1/copia-type domain-containing protein n=1 Tax=Sesamum latifolium TaxID=2727402 RepID=A0AAW2U1T0_9LAMI
MVRSMMSFTELPLSFWGYALEMAAKLLNMAPSKTMDKTLYKLWHGKSASYKDLRESSEATPEAVVASSSMSVVPNENILILRRSSRVSRSPEKYDFLVTGQLDNDLKTYEEAMSDIVLGKWLQVMRSKMDSMSSNKVWTLVDPPKGFKPNGCKWVYKRKLGAHGEVNTFKARLVVKGYT